MSPISIQPPIYGSQEGTFSDFLAPGKGGKRAKLIHIRNVRNGNIWPVDREYSPNFRQGKK